MCVPLRVISLRLCWFCVSNVTVSVNREVLKYASLPPYLQLIALLSTFGSRFSCINSTEDINFRAENVNRGHESRSLGQRKNRDVEEDVDYLHA